VFGTSAKYISSLEKAHSAPSTTHQLSQLRTILSTGSPLSPENFDYVYQAVKHDLMLCSISGGTDIVSCFALGNPMLPVYRGELQSPGLGMAVDVFDEAGHAIRQAQGELVCKKPFPSMPLYFWDDENNTKYQQAYFSTYPNVWAQGDFAEITEQGGLKIYGRSDAVLNPGGVRIGTAEIYRQVEKIDEVLESLAVDQAWQGDTRIILFVQLRADIQLDEILIKRIKTIIRDNASPRHVPDKVIQIGDIPRTMNGKMVELAVRNIIHGRPVNNKEALANPEVLEQFKQMPELQK